jgi:hypothetical protein
MELGERFRGGGTRGIARFLADHQHHEGGFDVQREQEPGSGRLRIVCLGCGESVSYRAGQAMDLTEVEEATGNGLPAPVPSPAPIPPRRDPALAAKTQSERPPGLSPRPRARDAAKRRGPGGSRGGIAPPPRSAPRSEGRGVRGWLPIILIGILILGGLGMIVAGLLKEDEQQPLAPAAPAPTAQEPAATPPETAPQPEAEAPPAAEPEPPATAQAPLRRRSFAGGRFSIGLPAGGDGGGNTADGFTFEGPGSTAAVTVFFEQGGRPPAELARLAADFLAQRHPGAQVGSPKPFTLSGTRGARVVATYGGGTESAVALSAGGFAYLVLERVDNGAPPDVGAQADAVLTSFKPG